MRLVHRLFAVILCVCLFIALVPMTALADYTAGDFTFTLTPNQTGVIITGYTGTANDLVIPSTVSGLPVVEIAENAFVANDNIQTIAFPNKLKTIGNSAFEACTELTAVSIPASVQFVGDYAFYNCYNLRSIELTAYTYHIGYHAFHNTDWLIQSQAGPVYVGRVLYTYFGAMNETTFTVRDYTAAIAPDAFSGHESLEAVYLPVGLRVIGEGAFSDCVSLLEVRVPPSATTLGENIFLGSDLVTIYGAEKSAIHQYTVADDIYFKSDKTLNHLDGDADQSGIVDSSDLRVLMRSIIGVDECDHERFLSCDIVYDGAVDTADVREWLMLSIM